MQTIPHNKEKEMATHSSILAWRIPGTEEPGRLLSMGSHRGGQDWSNLAAAAYPIFNICLLHTSFFSYHWIIFSFSWIPVHCKLHKTYLSLLSMCMKFFSVYKHLCWKDIDKRKYQPLCWMSLDIFTCRFSNLQISFVFFSLFPLNACDL